jgi:capsular polysaccharide transport system ATP-binding protein
LFKTLENPLIRLVAVQKSNRDPPHGALRVTLRPTTLTMPVDRRIAVLGKKRSANSSFLRLLAGVTAPTSGKVISQARLSPILKSNELFHYSFNGLENIRHYARILNMSPNQLFLAINRLSENAGSLGGPIRDEEQGWRDEAIVALFTLLPFDCYLIDEISQYGETMIRRHLDVVAQRGAGLIFTTTSVRWTRYYAEAAIVVRDGAVYPFSTVEQAIAFHER